MFRLICLFFVLFTFSCADKIDKNTVIKNMVDSVVLVDSSSGVFVYSSGGNLAVVLTANHTITEETLEEDGLHIIWIDKFGPHVCDVIEMERSENLDLALLLVTPEMPVSFSKIAKTDPELGEDVWIVANPNRNIRSIKKGIVSSKARMGGGEMLWELSGGIIYGSSGGGAFNERGELFGIARSVDTYATEFCSTEECLRIAIPDIGYFVPPKTIRNFILDSDFAGFFEYLIEDKE